MSTKTADRFTVSGPGVDKSYAEPGVALSFAITKAEHSDVDATFYVRDAGDEEKVVGYVERKGGETNIFRFGEAVA